MISLYSLLLLALLFVQLHAAWIPSPNGQLALLDGSQSSDERVNVTLYVMSRCPDARLCEDIFEDVLRSSGIPSKINFNLQFIAHLNKTDRPLGITCKHGLSECLGNAHDLCLQSHLPLSDFYASLSCLNFQSPFPGKIGDVDLTRRCAEASKVDWWGSGVGECIQGKKRSENDHKKDVLGKEAKKLLVENVRETERRRVEKSCTIEIGSIRGTEGKRFCVVDGGIWTGCDDGHTAADFVRVIEEEWKALQSNNLDELL